MRIQIKHYAILNLLGVLMLLLFTNKGITGEIKNPQQVIESISAKLQKKLQDKSFIKDFEKVTV